MSTTDWISFGLPPLRLTTSDVRALAQVAGDEVELSVNGSDLVEASELVPEKRSWGSQAFLRGPAFELELADSHATLRVDDQASKTADALQALVGRETSSRLSIALPLGLGAVLGGVLLAVGVKTDIAALISMGCMLFGIAAVSRLRGASQPTTTAIGPEGNQWQTTMPRRELALADLRRLAEHLGARATVHFTSDDGGPLIALEGDAGITLTLRESTAELVYENSAVRFEPLYNALLSHRRKLRWLTHDDIAILVGMALPLTAVLVAPSESQVSFAGMAVVPWLGYVLWVLRNQGSRWSLIVRD